jgi:hypothetical protein
MEKPVQWLTLQEIRNELARTLSTWESVDLDEVLTGGPLPVLGQAVQSHQLVAHELLRRPSST